MDRTLVDTAMIEILSKRLSKLEKDFQGFQVLVSFSFAVLFSVVLFLVVSL